ncbi:MAG: RNA methyltransferase [Peptococcaceae bacterium]|nr:RNA methyltransferase [Peptococcaceae bacterium]
MEIITSTQNLTIKEIRKLQQRKHRVETGLCFVEGIQPVLRALENDIVPQTLVYAPELLTSEVALGVLDLLRDKVRLLAVSSALFADISERDNPVGLAAIVRTPIKQLADLVVTERAIYTALVDIKNPGNLGTIVRTIDSIAGSGLIIMGQTADPYDPACIKASMGTVFNIPIVSIADPREFLAWCKQNGVSLITTSAKAPHNIGETALTCPCAVMLGSEAQGLPTELMAAGDIPVRIPMYGQASSLNLAVAAGIILYEVKKGQQRQIANH